MNSPGNTYIIKYDILITHTAEKEGEIAYATGGNVNASSHRYAGWIFTQKKWIRKPNFIGKKALGIIRMVLDDTHLFFAKVF